MRNLVLAGVCLLASCKSVDSGLSSANQVLAVARSPSVRTMGGIASASDRDARVVGYRRQFLSYN